MHLATSEPLVLSREPPAWKRYAVAVAACLVAALARLAFPRTIANDTPLLLFYAAVMATGWYGGFRPGMVATLLCAAVAGAFFMGRYDADAPVRDLPWRVVRLSFFLFEGTITSALCGQLHAARRRAEKSAAEARELERTVERISEAEQRRIGQDLHDGLGQHLTGVAFLSKALQNRLAADGRSDVAAQAATINEFVNESIRWTRDLARGLAPMDLDRTSVAESLRELVRQTSRLFNVECAYEGVDSVTIRDDEMALNLYRVAQEAVSNGVKHGNARNVTVELEASADNGLALSVTDDGGGFDLRAAQAAGPGKGMGLMVMRYRARIIGGDLSIETKIGRGTTVLCRVPGDQAKVQINAGAGWASASRGATTPTDGNGRAAAFSSATPNLGERS